MGLKIKYNLGDHGWANVKFTNHLRGVNMTVSYLHDTLTDFIRAANLLLKDSKEAKVLLMDEPGEHMIYLQSTDNVNLNIEIRWFKDWASWDLATEKEFETVFSTKDTIKNFSTQIFENATRILTDYGLEGYKAKWIEHDFPINEFDTLKRLLKK